MENIDELKMQAFNTAMEIIRSATPELPYVDDELKKDVFKLADKIYNYIVKK